MEDKNKVFLYIFLIVFFVFVGFITSNRKRVLVIHSYHPEFAWTGEITDEINRVLPSSDIDVSNHYMDTKRHPGQRFKEKAGEETRRIIATYDPDIIITVDDNAQEFVGKYYLGQKRPLVVFCGVNAEPEEYGYAGVQNVTGILERTPIDSIVEVMQHCFPKAKRFIHISDSSITSQHIHKEYHHKDWSPFVCFKALMIDDFEEWKKEVIDAQDKVDFLLYTHYHTIKRGPGSDEIVPPKEIIQWSIQNSKIPEIGNWGFFVSDGGMISIAVSPREQADVACDYARRLLKGEDVKKLPIVSTKKYSVYINSTRLKKMRIKLPMVYTLLAETGGHIVE